jgi:hypothetical protein
MHGASPPTAAPHTLADVVAELKAFAGRLRAEMDTAAQHAA